MISGVLIINRVHFVLLPFLLFSFGPLTFCSSSAPSKSSEDYKVVQRLNLIRVGTSNIKWELYLGTGGYQKLEEKVLSSFEFSPSGIESGIENQFVSAKLEKRDNFAVIYVRSKLSEFDFKQDVLPFVELEFLCGNKERFFGFGSWADYADATGRKRLIYTQEQHVGGEMTDNGKIVNPPWPFGELLTYFPVPFFVSSQNYAFFVTGFDPIVFSVCEDGKVWEVKVFNNSATFFVFDWKEKPLEAIEKFTGIVGRQKTPPIWAFGNWIDAIGGQKKVENTALFLRENKIPSSAIWTEDWAGGFRRTEDIYTIEGWDTEPSYELYPDIKSLSSKLQSLGFRFLGYFHHFVGKNKKAFSYFQQNELLLKGKDGKTRFVFFIPEAQDVGLLDLENPKTWEAMKSIMKSVASLGFSGWMADFGEWVTPDMISFSGKTGWQLHNLYPYLWAKLNREFWEDFSQSDFVFFSRSGFTGSWVFSPVVWQGDQNTSFERLDGLGSVIPLITSLGFSGVHSVGPDIAGYTSGVLSPNSDKELYIRWTSLCAFLPIFRTHHGVTPEKNWRFTKDDETLSIFRKYAQIHIKLAPFFFGIAKEGEQKGYPAVRHIFLEYPDVVQFIPEKLEVIEQEFLLGGKILVAPIVKRGETKREVFIPPGKWVDFFSQKEFDGEQKGKFLEVEIPLGEIFVLVKKGECIEIFDPVPDTLNQTQNPEIIGIDDVQIKKVCF
jgi:alpha-glucosidase